MDFEIDFLPVGEGERSGDAICFRFGDLNGTCEQQTVCIIDGGTKDSGERLVDHIKNYYLTDRVDYVFCTHPDGDHASGLCVVLESLTCRTLLMHQPWTHSESICHLFDDPKVTPEKLAGRMERNLLAAHKLEELAIAKKVPIIEPFAGVGTKSGSFLVLGPDKGYYQSLLPAFRDMPELAESSPLEAFKSFIGDAVSLVGETLSIETLTDPQPTDTSAENNSSMILLLQINGEKLLFTGDAGVEALERAVAFANAQGVDLTNLRFMQVPHHGSRRNVGPTILNKIKASTAFVSAAKDGAPKHPAKRVTNALKRRGSSVYATQGTALLHFEGTSRGWGPAPQVPFYSQVEDY